METKYTWVKILLEGCKLYTSPEVKLMETPEKSLNLRLPRLHFTLLRK